MGKEKIIRKAQRDGVVYEVIKREQIAWAPYGRSRKSNTYICRAYDAKRPSKEYGYTHMPYRKVLEWFRDKKET